jgi:hypothetical protein
MTPRATWFAAFALCALTACGPAAENRPPPPEAERTPLSDVGASSDLAAWDALSAADKARAIAMMGGGESYSSSPRTMYLAGVLACANARRPELDERSEIATLIGYCTGDLQDADTASNRVQRLRFGNGREWAAAKPEDRRAVLREYFFMTIAMAAQTGGKASELTIDTISACVTEAAARPDGPLRAIVDLVSECDTAANRATAKPRAP